MAEHHHRVSVNRMSLRSKKCDFCIEAQQSAQPCHPLPPPWKKNRTNISPLQAFSTPNPLNFKETCRFPPGSEVKQACECSLCVDSSQTPVRLSFRVEM